ncbi:MAG TPA: adenylate/guanylate cyclase domain-containing protein [Candidatus Limnocylindria bacterium]|nr:adenylate/guanylate cyclase domain-containing protein [Candidatus Limnocylindria bacterium]
MSATSYPRASGLRTLQEPASARLRLDACRAHQRALGNARRRGSAQVGKMAFKQAESSVAGRYVRRFSSADEVIEFGPTRSEMISVGGLILSHDIQKPGWRWSTHVKPVVGTDSCQVRHLGLVLRGRLHVALDDGTEFEVGPLDVMDLPVGHDAWVVGDEPFETFAWSGGKTWLAPATTLGERILATLLMTDVVDSTGMARRLGDRAWSDVLADHQFQTREIVARYRGRVVDFAGDGVLTVFDGAARAIRCSLALSEAAGHAGLAIRAAVHIGEVEVAEKTLHGIAIHEASRILGLAAPSEVLVSEITASLARDAGVDLEDRGEHQLRGLPGTYRLFAVSPSAAD